MKGLPEKFLKGVLREVKRNGWTVATPTLVPHSYVMRLKHILIKWFSHLGALAFLFELYTLEFVWAPSKALAKVLENRWNEYVQ